jgi:metal-responsive CopG/Arc/MetJ family transcriptional regulator
MVKARISVSLPKELVEKLDNKIKARIYANRSHAIEVLILEAMKGEKRGT